MRKTRVFTLYVLACASVACVWVVGCPPKETPPPETPPRVDDTAPLKPEQVATAFRCEVTCSEDQPGVSVMSVTWQDRRTQQVPLRLDVTNYKVGFQRRLFVESDPEQSGQGFRQTAEGEALKMHAVETGKVAARTPSTVGKGEFALSYLGVTPGMSYFWRLRAETGKQSLVLGETVCDSRVCPADEAR